MYVCVLLCMPTYIICMYLSIFMYANNIFIFNFCLCVSIYCTFYLCMYVYMYYIPFLLSFTTYIYFSISTFLLLLSIICLFIFLPAALLFAPHARARI